MESIINLAIQQLKATFGQDVIVYDEPMQQGLKTPCFFVRLGSYETQRKLGNNSRLSAFVFLTYYPSSEDKRTELDRVTTQIIGDKRWRYLMDTYHINNLKTGHNDEVLTVSFSVAKYIRYDSEEGEKMHDVTTHTNIQETTND